MGKFKRRLRKHKRYCPVLPKGAAGCHSKSLGRQKSDGENCIDDNCSLQTSDDGPSNFSLIGFRSAVAKISSSYGEDRMSAIKVLMSLPINKKNLKKFQDYNCLDTVSLLMLDPYIQHQATLFISKLTHSDSFAINESIANCILKSLCPLLKLFKAEELYVDSMSIGDSNEIQQQSVIQRQVFITAVEILSKLCEHNLSVIVKVNEEGLIPILFKFANPSQFGYPISLAILRCLLCVTETNEAAAACLSTDHLVNLLSCQPQNFYQIYFTALVSGVLVNIGSSEMRLVNPVFSVISHTIDMDIVTACNNSHDENNSELSAEFDALLAAQKLALEIVANICYIDVDSSNDSEQYDNEIVMESENSDGTDNDLSVVKLALQEYKIVEKVLAAATLSLENLLNGEGMQKHTVNKLNCIKIRAVLCLINLSGFLDCKDPGGSEILYNIFSHLGKTLLTANINNETLLEELSAAMRTVVENLCAGNCQLLLNITVEDLQNILDMTKNSSMKIDLSHVLGSLCCFSIENLPEEDIYREKSLAFYAALTKHLLQMGSQSCELWICAEALDIIIDVFSHDKTDRLAAQLNLVDSLRTIQKLFMVQLKKQRKKIGEHWPLIETVKDNLLNFIEHKTKRIANNKVILS